MAIRLNIVQPSLTVSDETFAKFTQIVPGSVCVAKPLGDGRVMVYFEGDLYGRGSQKPLRQATLEERTNYAKIAGGRAVENYPTTAKFMVDDEDELEPIGFILWDADKRSMIVRFVEADGSLSQRRNPEPKEELRFLESEYWDTPAFLRKNDLVKINALRLQLGLPQVDAKLQIVLETPAVAAQTPTSVPKPRHDRHATARDIYQRYLAKKEMMRPHLAYSQRMIRALANRSQTPVMPLATQGTGGGPVLCDLCHEQIRLEGGPYHGVGAGLAWNRERERLGYEPSAEWVSYILGHVYFLQETNGTFRAYHGKCHPTAERQDAKNREAYVRPTLPANFRTIIHEFLQDEQGMFGKAEQREEIYQDIFRELFKYDPGVGVNRP